MTRQIGKILRIGIGVTPRLKEKVEYKPLFNIDKQLIPKRWETDACNLDI
jgi:hypothetical protein